MIWNTVTIPLLSKEIILYVIYHFNLVNAAEPWDLIGLPNGRKSNAMKYSKCALVYLYKCTDQVDQLVPKQYTINISVQKLHQLLAELLRKEKGFQYRPSLEICL